MNINSVVHFNNLFDITPLLPKTPKQPKHIVDIIPMPDSGIYNILTDMMNIKWVAISYTKQLSTEQDSGADYERYLQFPNSQISALARTIVNPGDTSDTKMYKIEQWVQDNIKYVSDTENYGTPEMWAYPTVTLQKKSGDCEDGAFLMHSLALASGVSPDKLRTYGGLVWADQYGYTTGGHAWTAYKRETDGEWIITDWCYWAKDTPLAERESMGSDVKYIDDYFYVQADKTVETPYVNKVRYAQKPTGMFRNIYA